MRLGEIQGVEINDEGQLKSIWLVQEYVSSVSLKELKRRNFEIADILIEEGYKIENPKEFDVKLKSLLLKLEEEKR